MPTSRPNTDYERWLQNHNPNINLPPNPQYDDPSSQPSSELLPHHKSSTPFDRPQIYFSPSRLDPRSPLGKVVGSGTTWVILSVFMVVVAVVVVRVRLVEEARRGRR